MKSKIICFFLAFFVWVLLNWVPDWQHCAAGVFVALFVAYLTGDIFIVRVDILQEPKRYWYFAVEFIPVFIWECIKSNIDVAYRVIHPGLPIRPGIVKVKTKLKTDIALTFLANAITLTPGTMTVDINKEDGVLYIHWINIKTENMEEATQIIVSRFEKILEKVFE